MALGTTKRVKAALHSCCGININISIKGLVRIHSSVASSALSPYASSTGVVCVWNPVMDLGLPACPTTSTACVLLLLCVCVCGGEMKGSVHKSL